MVSSVTKGKTKSCLTVLVDRATRMTIIRKTASKTAKLTTTSIIKALKPYRNTIKSITYDNGCEFSKHEIINKIVYGFGRINYGWYEYKDGSFSTYTLNAPLQIPVPTSDRITYCTDVTVDSVDWQTNKNNVISYTVNEFQNGDILNTPGLVVPKSNVLEVSNARVVIDTAENGSVDVSGTLKCKELIIN